MNLGEGLLIESPAPSSKEEWVDIALENNYQLKAAYLRKDAARK